MKNARAEDEREQRVGDDGERFEDFLNRWLRDTIRPNMRPSTAVSYESVIDRHVIPSLGHLRIRDVTPVAVQSFYARLRAAGTGARTVQKTHAVLHRALASAERVGLLDRNPAHLEVDIPRYRAPEREPLTREQVRTLLRASKDDRLGALYVLALTTGARQGELFALRWGDLDLATGMISIRRSLQDADGRGTIVSGPTKTKASRRRFELPGSTIAALRAHGERLRAEGLGTGERDLVFPAANGEPLRRQNFIRRDFYPMLERVGLPKIHFHDLRHTAATLLAAAGAPVVQVAQLLGHVDPTITLRTYQHAFESAAGDAAKQLGALFEDPVPKSQAVK
jgi:integrase